MEGTPGQLFCQGQKGRFGHDRLGLELVLRVLPVAPVVLGIEPGRH